MEPREHIPFRGELQKMRLVANNMGYGPLPPPDEEVEQRLTVTANGKVWLSRWCLHENMTYVLISREQFKVKPTCTKSLFSQIAAYFSDSETAGMATDVAVWELELTNLEGTLFPFTGPCSEVFPPSSMLYRISCGQSSIEKVCLPSMANQSATRSIELLLER